MSPGNLLGHCRRRCGSVACVVGTLGRRGQTVSNERFRQFAETAALYGLAAPDTAGCERRGRVSHRIQLPTAGGGASAPISTRHRLCDTSSPACACVRRRRAAVIGRRTAPCNRRITGHRGIAAQPRDLPATAARRPIAGESRLRYRWKQYGFVPVTSLQRPIAGATMAGLLSSRKRSGARRRWHRLQGRPCRAPPNPLPRPRPQCRRRPADSVRCRRAPALQGAAARTAADADPPRPVTYSTLGGRADCRSISWSSDEAVRPPQALHACRPGSRPVRYRR